MTQEINLLLELDEYQEWIFSVVPSTELKSKIKEVGNESFKKIKAKYNQKTLDTCDKCSERLQINLYYFDETVNDTFDENGAEIDIEENHWEPECIIHRQDSYEAKEIKQEPAVDLEEMDFIGFEEPEAYELNDVASSSLPAEVLNEETIRNMTIPKSTDKNDPKPFKCPKCEIGFVAQKNVRRHLKNNSCKYLKATPVVVPKPNPQTPPPDEPMDEDSLRNLTIPRSTDLNDPKPYRCPKCDMGFVAQKNVRRHLKNNSCRSDDIQQGLRPYMCPNCKMRFTTRVNTKKHIARNSCGALQSANGTEPLMVDESDPKPFKCPECNIGFSCRKNVLRHLNVNACVVLKGNQTNEYLPKDLNLPDLGRIKPPYFESFEQADGTIAYVSYSARQNELRVTNFDPTDLKCELCQEILRSTSALLLHRQSAHFFPKNQPECAGCGKTYESTYEKRWHSFYCTEKFQTVLKTEDEEMM